MLTAGNRSGREEDSILPFISRNFLGRVPSTYSSTFHFLASKFLMLVAVESRKTPNMLMYLRACEQSVLVLSLLLSDSVGFVLLPTEL